MLGASLLAVAAVLTGNSVAFVETGSARVLRQVPLPAEALTVFAAPDGRLLLPLRDSDETAVISPVGPTERWPGRVFPVFFDEVDRMYLVFPKLLLVASYPERLPILRVPLPGLAAPWRAVSTSNGLFVAVCAAPRERRLVLTIAEPDTPQKEVAFADEPRALAMAPGGEWVAVGFERAVQPAFAGEPRARDPVPVEGTVQALAASADGRDALVGTGSAGSGSVIALRMNAKAGVKVHGSLRLPGAVTSIAVAGDEVVVIAGESVAVLAKGGRKLLRQLAIQGARQIALLPADPGSAVPQWSETPQSE